jgi:hypothetical protein
LANVVYLVQGSLVTFPYTPTLAGTYTLEAEVTDNLGNSATSAIQEFTVAGAPTITLTTASNKIVGTGQPLPITVTITSDTGHGVTVTNVTTYAYGAPNSTGTSGPWTTTLTGLAPGTHTVYTTITDSTGNTRVSTTVTVIVAAAPTAAITSAASGVDEAVGGNFVSTVNATSDTAKGVSLVSVAY